MTSTSSSKTEGPGSLSDRYLRTLRVAEESIASKGYMDSAARENLLSFVSEIKALEAAQAGEKKRLADLRANVITLCGSVRFRETFDKIAAELCFKGYIILSLNVWGTEPKTGYIDDGNPAKRILESAHFRKIDLSDSILVINEGAYVGKSTAGEIAYARANGKKVYWYNFLDAHYEQDKGKRPQFGESSWRDLINLAEAEATATTAEGASE